MIFLREKLKHVSEICVGNDYLSVCVSSLVLIFFFEVEWRRPSKEFSNLITCTKTSQTCQVISSVLFCYERRFPISPSLELWCDERTSGRSALFQITRFCGNDSRGNDHDDIDLRIKMTMTMMMMRVVMMMSVVNDDEGGDDDVGGNDDGCGDDDAGGDVLQIADFTANHLSCFSWWLQRCQEDCAQSR